MAAKSVAELVECSEFGRVAESAGRLPCSEDRSEIFRRIQNTERSSVLPMMKMVGS